MSKVITARIPDNTFNELKKYLKAKNMPVSKFISQGLAETSPTLFSPEKVEISNDTQNLLLSSAGGSLVGILVYKSVKYGLKNSKQVLSDNELELYSIVSGLASAIITSIGINQFMKED
jgi:hypothetical protein